MRSGRPDNDLAPDAVPGLASLAPEAVQRLIDVGRLVHIPQGWAPIHAQEPADKAYLILEGCMEVVNGQDTLADVCRGEFVGEMGLVEKALRSAQVTVTEPVLALAWPRADFQQLRGEIPEFDELVTSVARARHARNAARSG